MVTFPREMAWSGASPRKPMMVTVAALATECRLMACQVTRSGVQECAAARCGVSLGGSFVSATQSGSILPMRRRQVRSEPGWLVRPGDATRIDPADAHALALGGPVNRRRAIAERDVDSPEGDTLPAIAPQERRGRDLGRKDRSFFRIIDRDHRRCACSERACSRALAGFHTIGRARGQRHQKARQKNHPGRQAGHHWQPAIKPAYSPARRGLRAPKSEGCRLTPINADKTKTLNLSYRCLSVFIGG